MAAFLLCLMLVGILLLRCITATFRVGGSMFTTLPHQAQPGSSLPQCLILSEWVWRCVVLAFVWLVVCLTSLIVMSSSTSPSSCGREATGGESVHKTKTFCVHTKHSKMKKPNMYKSNMWWKCKQMEEKQWWPIGFYLTKHLFVLFIFTSSTTSVHRR